MATIIKKPNSKKKKLQYKQYIKQKEIKSINNVKSFR